MILNSPLNLPTTNWIQTDIFENLKKVLQRFLKSKSNLYGQPKHMPQPTDPVILAGNSPLHAPNSGDNVVSDKYMVTDLG